MPKIMKLCLHLLKLFRENYWLLFSGHGVYHPLFGVIPIGPDRQRLGQSEQVRNYLAVNYFRSILTYVITVPERCRRTDRPDDLLWHHRAMRSIAR